MKRTTLIVYSIFMFLFGSILGLFFHELGHTLIAFLVKAPVVDFHIGIVSYVQIDTFHTSTFQLALISIGSFLLPELINLVLLFSSNAYIVIFRILTAVPLYMHLLMSIVILIIGSNSPETWDILMFQKYSTANSIAIIILLMVIVAINVFLEVRNKGAQKLIKSV